MLSSGIDWVFSHWPLVVSIVGGVLSLIGIITEKRSQSKSWKKFSYLLILVGGILTIGAAAGTTVRQSAQQAETDRKNNTILSLSQQLLEQGKHIGILNKQLLTKSEEIAKLNREVRDSVVGGNSFCYIATMLKQGIPRFVLVHQGKFPLYDLAVRIVDLDKFEELKKEGMTLENLFKSEVNVNTGNLAPNQVRLLGEVLFQPKETVRLNIFFSARNGFFTQILRIKKVGTEWKSAFKVTQKKEGKQETLLEKIDDGYPRNEKGVVQW